MTDEQGFKIKGAASEQAEGEAKTQEETTEAAEGDSKAPRDGAVDIAAEASIPQRDDEQQEKKTTDEDRRKSQEQQLQRYRWCKCLCDPAQFQGRDHYFLQMDTQVSRWDEPTEPYWIWDAEKQEIDPVGLQQPNTTVAPATSSQPDTEYQGYNPKIHGKYDPTAPYAQFHNQKRQEEAIAEQIAKGQLPTDGAAYGVEGTFNRFTGAFQGGDKSAERHNDYNKSGRQLGAYFDVDSAANAHDGRSLKEERRNEKLSKKQIKALAEKRREKKEKKRMDFYKS